MTDGAKIEPMHILSLGAGVQSSTMALMAAHGEITPMPECAIFADTQAEPASVYKWLDWLEGELPYPVHVVTAGSLTKESLKMKKTKDGRRYTRSLVPAFTLNPDGSQGKIMGRSCTSDYKLRPILKKAKEVAQVHRGCKRVMVAQWIGISMDEVTRMKPSRDAWAECRWPLIEAGMNRHDCKQWMERNGYPEPPRSACAYCPFHSDAEWRRLRDYEPDAFNAAIEFERNLQRVKNNSENFDSIPFLHRSCVSLEQVDLST